MHTTNTNFSAFLHLQFMGWCQPTYYFTLNIKLHIIVPILVILCLALAPLSKIVRSQPGQSSEKVTSSQSANKGIQSGCSQYLKTPINWTLSPWECHISVINPLPACTGRVTVVYWPHSCVSVCYHTSEGIARFYAKTKIHKALKWGFPSFKLVDFQKNFCSKVMV